MAICFDIKFESALAVVAAIACWAVFAAEGFAAAPRDTAQCPVKKGCLSDSIEAKCSVIACRLKGCDGDFRSGECRDLKDLQQRACWAASSECGGVLSIRNKPCRFGSCIKPGNQEVAP